MTHTTILPEHGTQEHVIIRELKADRVVVACGYEHFNDDELQTEEYDDVFRADEPHIGEGFCQNCMNRLKNGKSFPKIT